MAKEDTKVDNKWTPLMIKGTALHAYTGTEDPEYGGYKLTLSDLSDEAVDALKAHGIRVYTNDEGVSSVKPKSKKPIKVVDVEGLPFTEDLGNGSKVTAKVLVVAWDKPKKVVDEKTDEVRVITHSLFVDLVKVTDFVPAGASNDNFDDAL
jgi:hypothetical protein